MIVHKLFGTLRGKSIAILGFAFKANTNDTRQSPSIDISKNLLEEGANLKIHDPKVTEEQIMKELGIMPCNKKNLAKNSLSLKNDEGLWEKESSINEAVKNVDAILILTEWDIYHKLDWQEISKLMRRPSWVFDTRSVVNPIKVKDAGLNLWRIGDGIIN